MYQGFVNDGKPKPQAAAGMSVTLGEFVDGLGTSVGWSLLFIVGATLLFQRRDFK